MKTLENKIDFAVILRATKANPNGDPLNGNRPRIDNEGYGEISDVCLKRKIRDRLMEIRDEDGKYKYSIFVQCDEKKVDDAKSLKDRADKAFKENLTLENACRTWFDVRAFGQVFAFKSTAKKKKQDDNDQDNTGDTGVSIPVRGPVSIHSAFSVEPVRSESIQITKSVNSETTSDGKKSSDTMGMKHRVDRSVYVFYGSINPQLAEKTGFSNEDADAIKSILPKLFENDESSARPAGSMEILKVLWWNHGCKAGKYSSAKVHGSLHVERDGSYFLDELPGIHPEQIDGF
jgi:CRISPR-associated protein Csd2